LGIISETSLDFKTLAALSDGFSKVNIPFKVDVLDWANIRDIFREMTRKDKIVIQASLASQ
jgi:hypothetical protein